MTQTMNQFFQTPEVGDLDLQTPQGSVISCQVDSTQATALVAGNAVTLVNGSSKVPSVIASVASDSPFGFVTRTVKDANGNVIHQDEFYSNYRTINGMTQVGRYPGDPPDLTIIPASEYHPSGPTPPPSG